MQNIATWHIYIAMHSEYFFVFSSSCTKSRPRYPSIGLAEHYPEV
jgi:hypothetical protein